MAVGLSSVELDRELDGGSLDKSSGFEGVSCCLEEEVEVAPPSSVFSIEQIPMLGWETSTGRFLDLTNRGRSESEAQVQTKTLSTWGPPSD